MRSELVLALLAALLLAMGCGSECIRHSDCGGGLSCSPRGVCEAEPTDDAGASDDAGGSVVDLALGLVDGGESPTD